uniref:Uncharacterized protein n=1 Tax=Siphoviridae sp. ct47J5 TaxID=2826286 RepID=A0A8S5MJ63_9CAUD|nr:MAG TPA: hypothetical protein [Siphoviridae sp. ct47J5]
MQPAFICTTMRVTTSANDMCCKKWLDSYEFGNI